MRQLGRGQLHLGAGGGVGAVGAEGGQRLLGLRGRGAREERQQQAREWDSNEHPAHQLYERFGDSSHTYQWCV